MKIDPGLKKYLVTEMYFVAQKVRESEDIKVKVYFFSAIPAAINRVFNLNYDPEIQFVHFVFNVTHNILNEFIINIERGVTKAFVVPKDYFDRIAIAIEEVARQVEENKSTNKALQEIANLSYLVTGNGNYLYQKGMIKLPKLKTKKARPSKKRS